MESSSKNSKPLRPGTPAPSSRASSPHVKQKIHQMSMSAIENEVDDKHTVTGSKSAPVPSRGGGGVAGPSNAGHHAHHAKKLDQGQDRHAHFVSSPTTPHFREDVKIQLAVVKGSVYIPTRTRLKPESNSFIETNDLGPPGAERRWLIDMKGFREDEISFALDGANLKVEGRQNTRPGKNTHHVENVVLPISYNIENFKIFRNKQIGTLVLAYLPSF